jgi:NADH-quinone oxidoreductase subunit C
MADGEQATALIRERFPDAVTGEGSYRDQAWVELAPERLVEVCTWLRDDPATSFDYLADVTAVHWPDDEKPIEMVYHLESTAGNDRLRIKVRAADGEEVPTLSGLWRSADWNERETFDMFGVRFAGHPDLRRILMPDDYTDFPLRKELPLYRG